MGDVLSPGDVIDGKYRVVRRIGEGGMGAVWEGVNLRINRRVAIKVMHAAMARHKRLVARFEREAQAAANIDSAHVVEVFDLGDLANGERYMVMEYLEGESLHARLRSKQRMTPHEIAEIGIQLLDGLAKVHQAGIVHRDLKPANIFLARGDGGTDVVKILDFGICKMTEREKAPGEISTGVGDLLGTLAYMSPEQLEHGSSGLDGRGDLYAVGVMLYRAVTGTLPYGAATVVDLLRELREGRAPQVNELAGDVDPKFGAIVQKALEWDRTARFATAKEFQRALEDWRKNNARLREVLSDFLETPAKPMQALGKLSLEPKKPAASENTPTTSDHGEKPVGPKRSRSQTLKMDDAPVKPDDEIQVDIDDEPGGPPGR
jgi:serine/threonine protein kinase